MQENRETGGNKVQNTFCNIVHAIDGLWGMEDGLYAKAIKQLPEGSKTNHTDLQVIYVVFLGY